MMSQRTSLVAANWKKNGSRVANAEWQRSFAAVRGTLACEVVVCAPAVYLADLAAQAELARIEVGAQDVSERDAGAYTGDISASMLVDVGCRWVIVGHSERRQLHGETDAIVAAKAAAALAAGLRPIVCVGESLAEREAGTTLEVVRRQLGTVLDHVGDTALMRGALAYEPVWAIGTGRTATPQQVAEKSDQAEGLRILYGGSVKPTNAAELFGQHDIDGGLIGGASLNANDFAAICAAAHSRDTASAAAN